MNGVRLIPARELSADLAVEWLKIVEADSRFASPYFRPEFTKMIGEIREDAEIAVIEGPHGPVGFFPFHRTAKNAAVPIGGRLSDYHAVVIRDAAEWNAAELMRRCNLKSWRFDHLLADQGQFAPYHVHVGASPYIDLSAGWAGYENVQISAHKSSFKRINRKLRQAEKDAGEVRIVWNDDDPQTMNSLIEWKRKQYKASGVTDVLSFPWVETTLRNLLERRDEGFAGLLTTLYVNDKLAAVMLSMRSHGMLHAWFSSYGERYKQFSPGLLLWFGAAKAAENHGVTRIDMGKGPEEYKLHLMSDAVPLAEGVFDVRPAAATLRRQWRRTFDWLRSTPLRKPLLAPGRFLRRLIEKRSFE